MTQIKVLVSLSLILSVANEAIAQDQRPFLSLGVARAGAAACELYARQNDLRVAISIKDSAGRLVYFLRMDDVYQKQIELAGTKAETAATTPISTKRLGLATSPGHPLAGLVHIDGLTTVEGGEPIRTETGYSIGGVGISGASPAQDGECARIAVEAMIQEHQRQAYASSTTSDRTG
ncbi:MAG: heme-binding protein [Woeseiaceae bacterium]